MMPTPKLHDAYVRQHPECRQRTHIAKQPCPDCGRPQLEFPDGTTACTHGGHALERELGIRRSPAKQGE